MNISINTLTIGDIHGRSCWKLINFEAFDNIIFIGDYVDSKNISNDEIISNLSDIIQLKKRFPQKIILLLGNHDIQYLFYPDYRCGGFSPQSQDKLTRLFSDNQYLFQIAFQIENYLWTHAGICKTWITNNQLETLISDIENAANNLNTLYRNKEFELLFQAGLKRKGKYPIGGPLWCDKTELLTNLPIGINQIAGHNKTKVIDKTEWVKSSLVNTNCLDFITEFYELTIHKSLKVLEGFF